MNTKGHIVRLQQLYFDIEDLTGYNPHHLIMMVLLKSNYHKIVQQLFKRSPVIFDNLFHIGLAEIDDHMVNVRNAITKSERNRCFSDLQFYFQQSVLDARSKLLQIAQTKSDLQSH